MVDLKVMAYFKLSLSTRNWDSAFFMTRVDDRGRKQTGGGACLSGLTDEPWLN